MNENTDEETITLCQLCPHWFQCFHIYLKSNRVECDEAWLLGGFTDIIREYNSGLPAYIPPVRPFSDKDKYRDYLMFITREIFFTIRDIGRGLYAWAIETRERVRVWWEHAWKPSVLGMIRTLGVILTCILMFGFVMFG